MKSIIITILTLFFSANMFGQVQITLDEDLKPFIPLENPSDRDYTMGLAFGGTHRNKTNGYIYRPGKWINSKIMKRKLKDSVGVLELSPGWIVAGTAFTPDDLQSKTPVFNDRPYSFLLYLSTKQNTLQIFKHRMYTSELNMGFIGTPIGKWVQTAIHKAQNDGDTKDPHTPMGWGNQISNGGEPTFLYSISREDLITTNKVKYEQERSYFELKHGLKLMGGYYTGATYRPTIRIGILDPRNWFRNINILDNGNKDITTRQKAEADFNLGLISAEERKRITDSEFKKDYYLAPRKWELFLFGSGGATAILYNQMLNGKFRDTERSKHTLSFNETEHLIFEWNTGIGLGIPIGTKMLNLLWTAHAGRTKQFNLPLATSHKWGAFAISLNRNR